MTPEYIAAIKAWEVELQQRLAEAQAERDKLMQQQITAKAKKLAYETFAPGQFVDEVMALGKISSALDSRIAEAERTIKNISRHLSVARQFLDRYDN